MAMTMTTENARDTMNHLYGLLMEINLHQENDDFVLNAEIMDPFIQKHLRNIKRLTTKYAAAAQQSRYVELKEAFRKLKEAGLDELKKLLNPEEQIQFQPLFRKFSEITPEDERRILDDQQFLALIEHLQKKLDEK